MRENLTTVLLAALTVLAVLFLYSNKVWPAESIGKNESEIPVLEYYNEPGDGWLVVKTVISPSPMRLKMTIYRLIDKPEKFRASLIWDNEYFANADNVGFDKKTKKYVWTEAVWNIKREDGNWTNFAISYKLRAYDGRYNGRRGVIFRISGGNATMAYRFFPIEDKPRKGRQR